MTEPVSQVIPERISQLPAATGLTGNEAMPMVQGNVTVQTPVSALPQGIVAGVVVYGVTGGAPFPNYRTLAAGSGITISDGGAQGDLIISADAIAGSGTVTSVSISASDGIEGNVQNPTSAAIIQLGLGDITPDTIVTGVASDTSSSLLTVNPVSIGPYTMSDVSSTINYNAELINMPAVSGNASITRCTGLYIAGTSITDNASVLANYGIQIAAPANDSLTASFTLSYGIIATMPELTGAASVINSYGFVVNLPSMSDTSSMVNATGFFATSPDLTGSPTLNNCIGMDIANQGDSGITNAYGIRIQEQTGAVNNYAINYNSGSFIVNSNGTAGINGNQVVANSSVSAVDNTVPRFNNTTGGIIQNSNVKIDDLDEFYNYYAKINAQSGTTYTFLAADAGKVVEGGNASPITFTLPNNLLKGWCCTVAQTGTGVITMSPAAGATLRNASGFTSTRTRYAEVTLYITSNTTGTNATYIMAGDGA